MRLYPLAAALAVTLAALACTAPAEPRVVSRAEAHAALESDAPPLFLDVRTREEYAAGHLPGALWVPHGEVESRLAELRQRRERLIVVYCESGRRSSMALAALRADGFEHVAGLDGDMAGWRAAGLPLESGPPR